MNWRRLLHALLRLYPRPWRDRYADETAALLDDLLTAERPGRARLALDLLAGAAKERVRPTIRPVPPPRMWQGYVNLWRHRDLLLRTSLDAQSLALLDPGEEVVGTFDAATRHPLLLRLGPTWLFTTCGNLVIFGFLFFFAEHADHLSSLDTSYLYTNVVGFAALALLTLAFCRLTGARHVMFALTTRGLVEFEMDWRWRPRAVVARLSAVAPHVVRRRPAFREVELGGEVVWVHRGLDPVLAWMGRVVP